MTLYSFLVLIHTFSAVIGIGPGFVMIYIVSNARNMSELRYAYLIRMRLHIFVMVGGSLLLITGLLMGALNPILFQAGWYVTSLILFLIALALGPTVLSPRFKPIKALLESHTGDEIPETYYELGKKLFFFERIENAILLIVIALMITKPF
ncbi:DUF2269 family protein [Virgibacillus necropolis]|uniref:DUF2269 domain-containing protein n=1 Tax=Virgibacillus necropolis TaxID=163877 RepID=A0A221MHS6_9BACI|nr:DUF2269 family protein [Virgibacillus necropolis]ASN07213.1 hypothetical protein CFK40_20505 [Virgibacillus necropolis]